jgi:hypothetical protein
MDIIHFLVLDDDIVSWIALGFLEDVFFVLVCFIIM